MDFRIPNSVLPALQNLSELGPEGVDRLVAAMASAAPRARVEAFAAEVASTSGLELAVVQPIVSMCASMWLARQNSKDSAEQFAANVVKALRVHGGSRESATLNLELVSTAIVRVLDLEMSLGTTAKAEQLQSDRERLMFGARVLTDVRHVFLNDADQPPIAALVLHELCISYGDSSSGPKDIYIAMDSEDLRTLRGVLDRAERKEKSLKQALRLRDLNILEDRS